MRSGSGISPGGCSFSLTLYTGVSTPALLVDFATLDFSMPYNVIIMSSTPIALIFCGLFNLLIRRFVVIEVDAKVD